MFELHSSIDMHFARIAEDQVRLTKAINETEGGAEQEANLQNKKNNLQKKTENNMQNKKHDLQKKKHILQDGSIICNLEA